MRRTYDAASVGTPPAELGLDSRLAASNMLSAGTRIAQVAFRDMQAGNAHFLTGEQSFIDAGRDLLAIGPWLP